MAFIEIRRAGVSAATEEDYARTWGPKIGSDAARTLYDTRYMRRFIRLVPGIAGIGGALGVMGSGAAVVGWVFPGSAVVLLALIAHAYLMVSQALTRWFGVRVWTVPRRPSQFDAWAASRGLTAPDVQAAASGANVEI